MLADLSTLKSWLRVTDTTQDPVLTQILASADRVVKTWTKRDLETTAYTGVSAEYHDGNGATLLPLYQRPVQLSPPGLTGTITAGSSVITNLSLSAQTYLSVGQPVQTTGRSAQSALGAFPQGAVITSVDSATQVTASANALASGSGVYLVFGLRVFLDPAGFGGDGTGGFATAPSGGGAEMFLGLNYVANRDSKNGWSRQATLTRLGGVLAGLTNAGFWYGEATSGGFLSAKAAPYWPRGFKNLRIDYVAGLGAGAPAGGPLPAGTMLPVEITTAVCMVAGYMRTLVPVGVPLDYEALGRQVLMAMQGGERDPAPEIGTVRSLLRPYREFAF